MAVEVGYSHVTHLYSGMSGVHRARAYRIAGTIESGLLLDELTVEIIADGKHLPASLLKLIYKCKGPDRIALCSDSIRAAGMADGEYTLGNPENGQITVVDEGVAWLPDRTAFAGSVATANLLVRNMVNLAGVHLLDAVKMATLTPARILKIDDVKGSIDKDKDADIVVFDEDINIRMTIVEGEIVYQA
jgi:N-acetylglucosamine-6-phosphate deacetylase